MNPLLHWLTSPEWTHVVGALLHSLWQGAILAVVLALVLRRLANPVVRYRCALGALGLLLIANLITWAVLNAPQPTAPVATPVPTLETVATPPPTSFNPTVANKTIVNAERAQPQAKINWTAWIALAWMFGALLMLVRASIKVAGAEKLRRSCRPLEDEHIALLVAEACRAVKLARKIRVAVTDKLTSPAVVGVLVPTLILPLSLFTTLTPTQIQFILLHELAHIRRGDYLANLFQLFAESLWFFNPAVWWISHQIRREREACCDALAIELSGAPADYARTLVHVAENILQPAPAAAPAFGDAGREPSSLADRVQRLIVPGYRPTLRLTWRAMLSSLLIGITLLVLSALGTRNTVGAILTSSQPTISPRLPGLGIEPDVRPRVSGDDSSIQTTNITTWTESVGYDLTTAATFVPTPITGTGQRIDSVLPLPIFRVRQITTNVGNDWTYALGRLYSYNDVKDKAPFLGDLPLLGKLFTSESHSRRSTNLPPPTFEIIEGNIFPVIEGIAHEQLVPWLAIDRLNLTNRARVKFEGQLLAADSIKFDRLAQTLTARGNVRFETTNGTTLADEFHGNIQTNRGDMVENPWMIRWDKTNSESLDHQWFWHRTSGTTHIPRVRTNSPVAPLNTRRFKVDTKTLYAAVHNETRSAKNASLTSLADSFRKYFATVGVDLDPQLGKSFFLSEGRGELMIRATESELDQIEKLLHSLNNNRQANESGSLAQIALATRTFAVGPMELAKALGRTGPLTVTNTAEMVSACLARAGVDLQPPKSVFFKDPLSLLLVRATTAELDALEKFLVHANQETASAPPTAKAPDRNSPDGSFPSSTNLHTRTFAVDMNALPQAVTQRLGTDAFSPGKVDEAKWTVVLRQLFASVGVNLELPESLYLNDRKGQLLVRAPLADLDAIETFLQVLNHQAPQVNIKVRWIEIPKDADLISLLPGPTNAAVLPVFRPQQLFGVLTESQTDELLRRLRQNKGFSLVSEGQVTTLSARQAQLQVAEVKTIMTGIRPEALTAPGIIATNAMDASGLNAEVTSLGPVLDVMPVVSSDHHQISLHVEAATKEFLGYAKKAPEVRVHINGKEKKTILPLPRYLERQMTNDCVLRDGQTLVLGHLPTTEIAKQSDGTFQRTDVTKSRTNNLCVLVTATLIDPAGNRLNPRK